MGKLSFLFLGANSPWAYGLAEALAQYHPTYAIQFYDWLNYHRLHPTWPSRIPPSLLYRTIHVLPPGYAGRLEGLFRFYLQQLLQRWHQQLKQVSGQNPWVIAPYPYLAPWVRKLPTERLIYYNFDDYVLYQPRRERKTLEQESELIEGAAITLCASYSQVITLQKRHPYQACRIHHYPHGVVDSYLNPQPENPPEPMSVGYVGNLIERVNWQLVYQVAQACPEIKFVFVGSLDKRGSSDQENWQAAREAVLSLPNVCHVGKVKSDRVAQYYWSFTVNWIPYAVKHTFNQAACPTKIMDGIASGRPLLSTDIPECRLYPEWISIFHSAEDAITHIRRLLAMVEKPEACEKRLKQLEFAQQHTWSIRAQTLEDWLSEL